MVEGDRAVSICFSSHRPGTAPGSGVEAGVDSLEGHRRRGYATRVIHARAAELLRQGRVPLYSTSWDNSAARAVARRLDMRLYGVSWGLD
ncbi:MAG TPA: GNAT family N-acetyltransferase [Dehalococcoidia bacterium]|nr:GNAT family N-acetyltransferase [Dehalococcoidia bacterium]